MASAGPGHSQGARRARVYSGSAQGGAGASCEHPVWGRGRASRRGSPGERTPPGAAAAAPWAECSKIYAGAMDRSRGKWFLRPGRKAWEIRGRIGLRGRRRGGGGRAWRALNTWTQVPPAAGVISCVSAPPSPLPWPRSESPRWVGNWHVCTPSFLTL